MIEWLQSWSIELWRIFADAGAWLLVGFLLAGAVRALIPEQWLARQLGGRGLLPILKAALIGVPLPLCSCSVIPAAAGLRRAGASRGAVAAFAISTPEVDAPSIALTWGLMGPAMAVARPIVALATAIAAGVAIDRLPGDVREVSAVALCGKGCPPVSVPAPKPARSNRLLRALEYGLVELPTDLSISLLAGLAISALLGVMLPPGWIAEHVGGGAASYLVALLVGIPLYVCATASTPLAAGLIAAGASPGAALVFMLAGPATNTATIAWILKDLGARALAAYLASIAIFTLAAGVAFDRLTPALSAVSPAASHHDSPSGVSAAAGAALAVVLVLGLARDLHARLWRASKRCA